MPLVDHKAREQRYARVRELLEQGLTTRQICLRTGVGERQILRIRKKLRESVKQDA